MIYNVPVFTAYDIPAELVIELAGHPNVIAIKESSGDVEKVRRMVEGTRHIKRSATVTETFDAVTPRLLAAAASATSGTNGQGGALVQVGALAGNAEASSHPANARDLGPADSPAGKPSSSAVTVMGRMKTRQKEVGFQVLIGAAQKLHPSLEAGAVGAILAFACPAPTACYEIYAAWKEGDTELARLKQERIVNAAQRVGGDLGVPGIKHGMDLNGYFGGSARLPLLPLTGGVKAEIERLLSDIKN
jgi:4-hydroxy-2-oxoglutarate aldolase